MLLPPPPPPPPSTYSLAPPFFISLSLSISLSIYLCMYLSILIFFSPSIALFLLFFLRCGFFFEILMWIPRDTRRTTYIKQLRVGLIYIFILFIYFFFSLSFLFFSFFTHEFAFSGGLLVDYEENRNKMYWEWQNKYHTK